MKFEGGQYGHHNHSDHHRHTVAYRRRLVRPRTVVLGSDFTYIDGMLWRVRNPRGRPLNVPAAFIHPCRRPQAELLCALREMGEEKNGVMGR
jgi:hypothetical protein